MFLLPRAMYKDPFRKGDNILVICDTWVPPQVKEDNSLTEMEVRHDDSLKMSAFITPVCL